MSLLDLIAGTGCWPDLWNGGAVMGDRPFMARVDALLNHPDCWRAWSAHPDHH